MCIGCVEQGLVGLVAVSLIGLFFLVRGWQRSAKQDQEERLPRQLLEPVEMNSAVPLVEPMWRRRGCELCQGNLMECCGKPADIGAADSELIVYLCDSCLRLGAENYSAKVAAMATKRAVESSQS